MITQLIDSRSKLADYKKYHSQAKLHIEELERKLENKVLSLGDYRNDLNRRFAEHNQEVHFLARDLKILFTVAKKQVVQLFPVN